MVRLIFCFIFALGLLARGSDVIPAPKEGVSASVSQPHVVAELISEIHVPPGSPFLVALHLHMDPGWHTYWINPGDAGLATTIKWTLPEGFTAGPIQWPTPEIHKMGPLTTYGYAGDVYLLTEITPPLVNYRTISPHSQIKAHAEWLVCEEECIPGKADLDAGYMPGAASGPESDGGATFFATAKQRLPVPNTTSQAAAEYGDGFLTLTAGQNAEAGSRLYFFPEQQNVLAADEDQSKLKASSSGGLSWPLALQQNGDKPDHLSGILVSDQPLQTGGAKAVYISSFPVTGGITAGTGIGSADSSGGPSAAATPAPVAQDSSDGHGPPRQGEAQPFLIAVLGAAFLGGLILNLMPCVLPVLSLKVFSLMRHAGNDPRGAWKQGAAFTVGVVISFWILAGLLIALRAAGNHLGWGFQMQSPGFVLALIFLFFLLGLNLFGVFELGTSLVGLDAKATGHVGNGLVSSFLNGALATLAATPCTAPFMGSSVGFAAEQPAWIAMLIFTVLALGMATPYLLLTVFPGALRFVPKPGAWMEAFKQFMGFLLMATVIFLVYVFGALVGQEQVPYLLAALLTAGVGAWIYGRWATPVRSGGIRLLAILLALAALGYAIWWGTDLAQAMPAESAAAGTGSGGRDWKPWTQAAVDQALAKGQPVFVDFTAAWCLSCKVNEQVALETSEVKAAFAKKDVALFRADWTRADPAISDVLAKFHRDGVPLYLLYSPRAKDSPEVLPAVLTPGLVEDDLGKLP